MKTTARRVVATTAAALLGGGLMVASPAQAADPVPINLIGINDFHGRIDASTLQWAGTVETLRAQHPDSSLMVSAGDNVSASLFASAIQKDEPTLDVLNAIGLDASAAGNHEFDFGYDDLINRIIPKAEFPILGANVFKENGDRALDASATFDVKGVKVAVVGAVTQETPTLVSPAGVAGLRFDDPSDSINDAVDELEALPEAERPDVIVASYHEGAPDGTQTLTDAMTNSAVFNKLVNNTSAEVDAIFMGHTHQKYAYDAPVPGEAGQTRPIIQTGNYGENVGQIVLSVDPDTGDVVSYTKQNLARVSTNDAGLLTQFPSSPLPEIKKIRDDAVTYANTVGNVEKGQITADITRAFNNGTEDRGSESTMGGLVADALLETVKNEPAGADIGIVNPGGLRPPDLLFAGAPNDPVNTDGVVTYAELNAILPFANNLNSVKVSGATLKKILEQQWQRDAQGNVPSRPYLQLGTSKNFTYTYDDTKPEGSRIQSIRINGEEYDPAAQYKVATFSFLATGGDNFRAFKEGVTTDTGLVDRDGWVKYFENNSPISPDFARRSVRTTGVKSQYRVGATVSYTLSKLNLTSNGSPSNTSVSSKLFYTEDGVEKTKSLASKAVTGGTSAPITFTLPAGVSGAMRVESTAFPSGTKTVVPLDVTGASVTADDVTGTFGDDVDVALTVTGPEETPSGAVVLKKGDTEVGSGTLDGEGSATITVDTAAIGAGESTLTIAYAGDANYLAANGSVKITVAKAGTTTSATEPQATKVDDPAAVPVAVDSDTGTTPTGGVTISDGDTVLGTGTLADGATTVSTDLSGLSIGQHTLTVDYAGDDDHAASTTTVDVDVLKGTTELTVSSEGSAYGTSAKVKVEGDEGASGLIYIGHGDDVVGIGFLKDGVANVSLGKTSLTPGTYELDLYYGGSATFDSAEATVGLTITKGATTTKKISVSPTKIVKNRTKPYVTVGVTGAGFTVDGGKVTVRVSSKNVVTGTVVDGRVKVRLGVFTSTGSAKTVTVKYHGNAVAEPSSTSFTVKVVSK